MGRENKIKEKRKDVVGGGGEEKNFILSPYELES